MSDFSFTKKERICRYSEFKALYTKGEKRDTEHFFIFMCPNGLAWRRLGITVSKKIGTAVNRNHVKRLVREYFRLHKNHFPESCDILFVAKPGSHSLKYYDLCEELNPVLRA